ncbi:MAG: GNAT family N-acetyltransferase [Methanosarcina sp.]
MRKIVRLYKPDDCKEIVNLFYDSVHTINLKHYNAGQLDAWAPKEIDISEWQKSLSNSYTVVVECNGIIVGFGNLDDEGYFDKLYVHKDFQGQRIASIIADELEKYAWENDITIITTEASITSRRFFEKRGYQVLKQQNVELRGQTLTNFVMQKHLLNN